MREAIITTSFREKGKNVVEILTFHWFVAEETETEIVVQQCPHATEQIVFNKKIVEKISYLT